MATSSKSKLSKSNRRKDKPGPSWLACPYCTCIGRVIVNRSQSPRVRLLFKPFLRVYRCTTCNGAFARSRQLIWIKSTWHVLKNYRSLTTYLLFKSGDGLGGADRKSFVVMNESIVDDLSGNDRSPSRRSKQVGEAKSEPLQTQNDATGLHSVSTNGARTNGSVVGGGNGHSDNATSSSVEV